MPPRTDVFPAPQAEPGDGESRAPPIPPDFAAAVAHERARLVRIARARLRDATLAEDVVQDTLLAALHPSHPFAAQSSLRTWLTGILLNKIGDMLRTMHRARARDVVFDDADSDDDDAGTDANGSIDWREPARVLEGRQRLDAVQASLAALSPRSARAMALRTIEGWSNDAVARELGLTAAQCSLLLHRARAQLRRDLHASRA